MSDTCARCPCPDVCLRRPEWCEWAAGPEPNPLQIRSICERSRIERAAATPPAAPPPRPRGLAKELVVARYHEDVAWLDDVPGDFHVSLYDKSDEPYAVGRQCRRVRLPNVGRESHSYAHHIVAHYDDLADVTYFAQGDAVEVHAPDFIGRLAVEYADTTSLTERYREDWPPPGIKAQDRVESHGGFEVRYGNAMARDGDRPYTSGWHEGRTQFFFPDAWPWVFSVPMPDPLWFGYGAMYAVPRRRLLGRPLGFWRWLLSEIERTPWQRDDWLPDAPLTGWQLEALWGYILGDTALYPHRPDRVIEEPAPAEYPSLAKMAGHLAGAVGRAAVAAVKGQAVTVPREEFERRMSICRACPEWDADRSRCRRCGCTQGKQHLAREQCPLDAPRWGRWTPSWPTAEPAAGQA